MLKRKEIFNIFPFLFCVDDSKWYYISAFNVLLFLFFSTYARRKNILQINKYICANSLEEAYASLMKNPKNIIIGGMIWLKMEDRMVPEAIDLSNLGLDTIEESDTEFKIGSMVTLRQLETHASLNETTCNVLKDAVKDIVGVQLRNLATIGGSVFSRFGFSDVLTALMCLDATVHLYNAGEMSISEFSKSDIQRDIITHITIKKNDWKSCFMCVRQSATDLSVLNVAVSKSDKYHIVVGARPAMATRFDVEIGDIDKISTEIQSKLVFGSNMRGSSEYRKHLCKVLVARALRKVEE